MTAKAIIKTEIKTRVGASSYSSWRIGLTHDLAERKRYWRDTEGKDVNCWTTWTADALADAQEIEAYYIHEKMMDGGTGGNLSSRQTVHIYIF